MQDRRSLCLIMLLLAALFFGPVIVLTQGRGGERGLKPIARQERLLDAPASLQSQAPLSKGGAPSARFQFPHK